MKHLLCTLALLWVAGCARDPAGRPWLGAVEPVASPAPAGSRFPNLAAADDTIALSWLQPGPDKEFELQFAQWLEGGLGKPPAWSDARRVAAGTDWFINWADFPSVVPVTRHVWAAHWLQQKPQDVYSYDVRIAVSDSGGRRWSQASTPHDDGTPTEHGFVSLLGSGEDHVRAIWLDGRRTPGEHGHADGHGSQAGAMTLRVGDFDATGRKLGADAELDARVCDCCQTDAVRVGDDTIVVYRDRSEREVRNIRALRIDAQGRTSSVAVHDDGWRIAACPVNGPAIAARGVQVAVAWFTAPDVPRVRLAFSKDGGRTFGEPIEVANGKVAGRVDVVITPRGRAVVSWLEEGEGGSALVAQPFSATGPAGAKATIADVGSARASGFPQMALAGEGLVFAWTEIGDPPRVRTAYALLR